MAPIKHVFYFLDFFDPIWHYLYKKMIHWEYIDELIKPNK